MKGGRTIKAKDEEEAPIAYVREERPRLSDELKRDISVMSAVVAETELRIAEIMARFKERGASPFVEPDRIRSTWFPGGPSCITNRRG